MRKSLLCGWMMRWLALWLDAAYLETIDYVARENTWDMRASEILAALQERSLPSYLRQIISSNEALERVA
jgi:hypothetical protein